MALDDKELLRLQDSLGCDVENMLRSSHYGKTTIDNNDVKLLYDIVVQFRAAARNERERFAKWCREAAAFRKKKGQSAQDPEELTIAYAYEKLAHQLEENYLPEIPQE